MKSEKEILDKLTAETKASVEKEFRKAKEIVEEVLKEDERARNDYKWLALMVWQRKQLIKVFIPYNQLWEMMDYSTIHRVCQVIQHDEGKYLPTDTTQLLRRRIRENVIREYFGKLRDDKTIKAWEERAFGIKPTKKYKKEGENPDGV